MKNLRLAWCLFLQAIFTFLFVPNLNAGVAPPAAQDSLQPALGHLDCVIVADTNCTDQTVTLSAYGDYLFTGVLDPLVVTWSNGATAHKITVAPPGTWSYPTSGIGCDHFHNIALYDSGFYDGQPEITQAEANCYNEAVLSVNTQGYSNISAVQWNTGYAGTPYTINQSGNYSVTVSDAFGCTAGSDTVAVQLNMSDEENCFGFCVDCSLGGFQGNNGVFAASSDLIICGGITLHNDSWYGFVAGSESITFDLVTSNCQNGDGLQFAVFDNCDDPDALTCNPGCGGCGSETLTMQYNGYVPGETYWLVVDGWISDVCDFTIEVTSGSLSAPAPEPAQQPEGPTTVCPGATAVYSIPAADGAGFYHWTAPEGASINGGSNDELVNLTAGTAVTITFGTSAGAICVQSGNACHPLTATQCLEVSMSPIPTTIKPEIVICPEDAPFTWDEEPFPALSTPGTYVLTSAPYASYLGCDSLVRQTVVIQAPIVVNLGIVHVCPGECFSIGGESFCDIGNYSVVLESALGCDSVINFFVMPLNPNADIQGPNELNCSQPVIVLSSANPSNHVWTNLSGEVLGTDVQLTVDTVGTYILQTMVEFDGLICQGSDTMVVTSNQYISDVDISGAELGCLTDSLFLTATTSTLNPEFIWETPGGTTLNGVEIYAASPGVYLLTVTDANGCTGTDLVLVPATGGTPAASVEGDTLTCLQLTGQLDGFTDESGATFAWSGPNGFVSQEENPVVTEAGNYTLVVTAPGGCTNSASTYVPAYFEVPVANLAQSFSIVCDSFPILDLQTSGSNLSFLWSGPAGFSSTQQTPQATAAGQYSVVVTNDVSGCTTAATTMVFEDLVFLELETMLTHPTLGQSNGSIDINVSGSNPIVSFAWYSNGVLIAQTEDLTNVPAGTYEVFVTDSYGCIIDEQFTLTGISASQEALAGSEWHVSPNPNSGKFQLQAPAHTQGPIWWKVHDSRGKLLVEQTGALLNQSTEIDLGAIPAGVYFLEIQTKEGSAWERIVVQR